MGKLHQKQAAFTLIELSIVLVVIGLIVGGVLVGRNLIAVAEARSVMTQLDKIEVAINAFRTKYDCMPGDCASATTFGLGPSGNGDGAINGSSVIDSGVTGPPSYDRTEGEEQWLFVHLAAAGMVQGQYSPLMNDTQSGTITNLTVASQYFPILTNGQGFITSLTWNGMTFLRTGWQASGSNTGPYDSASGSVTGSQMQYITAKYGYSPVADCTNTEWCGIPSTMGQKVMAVGVYPIIGSGNEYGVYLNPADSHNNIYCINGSTSPPTYDSSHGYSCNILWKISGF